ncbi:hypothetical protein F5X68DRAFT_267260 [Plectosphaerella plurivora]|uniref:Uncharacterized protein n=1 Tax=Plectosphaerella plurivora TaxID=936078 RepID=A0A9P8VHV0_9PEZI|nr:hypothetical protein F5X68DRAFT_267260 [Plectosphaerella plurivora]
MSEGSQQDNIVIDVGWDQDEAFEEVDLVEGLDTEDFWTLVRRFNKQIFHVKATSPPPPGGLDLDVSSEEDFAPNKMRAQFERLYMGIMLGTLAGVQHVARLRSWREPRRTAIFCSIYFLAWALGALIPTLLSILVALILRPDFRPVVFPPAPLGMVNYQTGGLSAPHAGVLGSTDSATGAPENMRGEAVENEASNFVTGIAAIAMNVLTDEDPQHANSQKGGGVTELMPSPNEIATKVAVAKDKAAGVDRPSQDKTKVAVEELMWSQMRPLMHAICVVSDTWERFANMLDPIPPFTGRNHRLRLVALVAPLIVSFVLVPGYLISKVAGFTIGFGVFGQPLIARIYEGLNLQQYNLNKSQSDIGSTLLLGVPTDAQLVVTLLRLGEAQNTPLPPPPEPHKSPPKEAIDLDDKTLNATGGDRPLGATEEELDSAASIDPDRLKHAGGDDNEVSGGKEGEESDSKRKKFFSLFKKGARGAAKTAIAVDKTRAKRGRSSAKARLGAASDPKKPCLSGPLEFQASYDGMVGFVYLTTDPAAAALCFSEAAATDGSAHPQGKEAKPVWTIPVADMVELNKFSGYGTKSKMMAGWALDKAIMDGVEIVDRSGKSRVITAVPRRDQLFNRLCTMGEQSWKVL